MERNFMGLPIKQEIPEETVDSAQVRPSAMQWSFPKNVSAFPQFLSFKGAPEDKPKTGFDSLVSTGLVSITTTETFDSGQKSYSSIVQKNKALEKPALTHYTVTTYPAPHLDAESVNRSHEIRPLSVIKQTSQTLVTTPLCQSFIAGASQKLTGSPTPQPLGPGPAVPYSNSIVGSTGIRNPSSAPVCPAQLTIFYAGSVCVYDDISPEKAQAIMLLAGNGPSMTSSTTVTASPPQAPAPRNSIVDNHVTTQTNSASPCLSSPITIASYSGCQTAGIAGITKDSNVVKPIGTFASHKPEPPNAVGSLGSAPINLIPSAVPQARKASLARFLEKRKERLMSTSPYTNKQSPECSTPASGNKSFSANSSGSSAPTNSQSTLRVL